MGDTEFKVMDFVNEQLRRGSEDLSYLYQGRKSTEYVDFEDFFGKKYPDTKRDLLTRTVYTRNIGWDRSWTPILNHKKVIESQCARSGLQPSYVERYLSEWLSFKKPELLITIKDWDNKDHIKDALEKISVKNISHVHFEYLMKEWLAGCYKRMYDSDYQNRFVVFRGPQGVGKDFAIRSITSGFKRYVDEIDFTQSKTEINRAIRGLAVAIIPEFDETNRASISTLKSIITGRSIKLRELYKNEAESVSLQTSFISASNFDNVLRDSSGNRRFMIFDIEDIEHTFEKVDGDQILAQAMWMANDGFKAPPEAQLAMKEIIRKETPPSKEDMIIEEVDRFLRGSLFSDNKVEWGHVEDRVVKLAAVYRTNVRTIQIMLRRREMSEKVGGTVYYYPMQRVDKT